MSKWVWVLVPYPPDATTRDDDPVSPSQCSVLPNNKLPIGGKPKLFVVLPWVWTVSHSTDIIPDPPGQPQNPPLHYVCVHVRHHGDTGVQELSTAFPLYIGRHLLAFGANAPGWLLWVTGTRLLWVRCGMRDGHGQEVKDEGWFPFQTQLQQIVGSF